MKWGIELRALVYLRRIARSLESLARSQATLADLAERQATSAARPRITRPTTLGEMTYTKVQDAEEARQREREVRLP